MKKIIVFIAVITFGFVIPTEDGKKSTRQDLRTAPKSDVFMQGFYWNSTPGGIWYDSLSNIAARLASAGFGAIWIPPSAKGGGGMSMGYDIYDHYDFGQFNQKGSLETRFGSRSELENMISAFQSVGIDLFYDAVLNHAGNGDSQAQYQCGSTDSGYVIFNPLSGRFPKTAANFHPNNVHCDQNSPYHNAIFFEDLCYYSGGTGDSLIAWCNYIKNVLGFNGFRVDAIKHIEPQWIAQFSQAFPNAYIVGEHWSSVGEIMNYYSQVTSNGGNVSLFDFPLRYSLKDMCNNTTGSFDMNNLYGAGLINAGMNPFAVATFVENHDFDRKGWDGTIDNGHDPVLTNKEMGYSYIIFSEGRPSVFYKDYFDYGLSGKIDTLIWIRQTFLYGGTTKGSQLNPWFVGGSGTQVEQSRDLFVARRNGGNGKPQAFIVLNDHPTEWRGVWVDSNHPNEWFKDYTGVAINKQAAGDGRVELYAPPRGYAIYIPDTTQTINNPPVIEKTSDLTAYTNSFFNYKINASDANGDQLQFSISGNPNWLSISNTGLLNGTPAFSDTGSSQIIVQVADGLGGTDSDTFFVNVEFNRSPSIESINDTTVKATFRYEYQTSAYDPDGDTLRFGFLQAPNWLNIGELSGLISGTPTIDDTGSFNIKLFVTDLKGAFDSTSFNLTVINPGDTIIATYGKPFIDGNINIGDDDWLEQWRVVVDSDTDSYWHPQDSLDNEILGLFVTWDADSLYLGVDYVINDNYNTMMLYFDAGIDGGITNFNSNSGYTGDYQKNFRFRQDDAIDAFIADYYLDEPSFYMIDGTGSVNLTEDVNGRRGDNASDAEIAIAWNTLYNLGSGLVPPYVELKFVGVIAGGFNYGGGDSAPNNPDINGDAGPDSLIFLVSVFPDTNGNGIPDPTVIISSVKEELKLLPTDFKLYQNYPNPFNPLTKISFDVPGNDFVELKIYDLLGREIAVIVEEELSAGQYTFSFNAAEFSSGVYFYRLKSGDFVDVKKMVLIK